MKHKIVMNRDDIIRVLSDYLLDLYDGFYMKPVVEIENAYNLNYGDIIATIEESTEAE